jgi:hypothetical protein
MIGSSRACVIAIACFTFGDFCSSTASAGNEANFVLYDHHTDKRGTTEVNALSDFSGGAPGDPGYAAQIIEIERALTDQWTAALYFEGDKIDDQGYAFGGWRFESRYRLFPYGAFLNPVLYVEYEDLRPAHRYLLEVVGRTDAPESGSGREIESRLILGHDFSDGFDVAFNWINDVNLSTGNWEFGYALGLNYTAFERPAGSHGASGTRLKEVKFGAEIFGGVGDSDLGLTLNPDVTQQYAELNLRGEFESGVHVQIGGAAGLTPDSERGLLRLMVGYEFE